MSNEKKKQPQTPEEMMAATQDAMKEAMEQAQALYGNIPGFNLAKMQEKLMADAVGYIPGMDASRVQYPEVPDMTGMAPEEVLKMYSQNLDFAGQMVAQCAPSLMSDEMKDMFSGMDDMFGSFWEINKKRDDRLTAEQSRLLAFGAPLLVLNEDYLDSMESTDETYTVHEKLESGWDVTDRKTAIETINWLLGEGHHADMDKARAELAAHGIDNITEADVQDENSKLGDVCVAVRKMLEDDYCSADNLPITARAWDLVRAVVVARWAYLCEYINEEEAWQVMQAAAKIAGQLFSSWEEYGLSFILGRGAWQGDEDLCEGAYEIISLLLEDEDSPWKEFEW